VFNKNWRGIDKETFNYFNIGVSDQYPDQLLIPLYANGQVCGFIRHIIGSKYLYNFYNGYVPFNFHNALSSNLYVVEGVFDALSVWQTGQRNVIGILGTGNIYKVSRLLRKIMASNVKIMFDGDETGYHAAEKLHELYPSSKIITLPSGSDPNSLSNLEDYIR